VGRTCNAKPKQFTKNGFRTESSRKKTLWKTKLRWEDLVKRDVEDLGGGAKLEALGDE